jgi:TolA-binding protein
VSAKPPDDLPPDWEELGREDAEALGPPDGAKERVGQRVAVTLGLGAGLVAATAVSTTAAAASVAGAGAASSAAPAGSAATGLAGTLLAKKIVLVGVAAAVGIGGGTAALLEVRSERQRNSPAAAVQPARPPGARPQTLPPPEPPPVESAPPDTLGEERTLLDRARMDIGSGELAGAGALLTRHAAQFPAGRLAEEREALIIRLLVRQGRDPEARAHAARFRREHPRSIQLPGIADALREGR